MVLPCWAGPGFLAALKQCGAGGFRVWWRRGHHDCDAELDNTHLMRMAGRFARRVKAWGAANGVPVIFCKAGERKHRIAAEYLATHEVGTGVFLVLAAKAPAPVWKVARSPTLKPASAARSSTIGTEGSRPPGP